MANLKTRWSVYLLGLVAVATLSACSAGDKSSSTPAGPLSGRVTVDGSATVFPLFQAMAAGFRETNPAVEFAIEFSGTGGGFKKFCAGQVDVTGASRPIKSAEDEQCKSRRIQYIKVPVAFDSLTVVVNPKNTFVDCLTVNELKSVWEPGGAPMWLSMSFRVAAGCKTSRRAKHQVCNPSGVRAAARQRSGDAGRAI
jgi:phosphate transport system substrate-binding protein